MSDIDTAARHAQHARIEQAAMCLTHLNKFGNVISFIPAARALGVKFPELSEVECFLMIELAADAKRIRSAWMLPDGYPYRPRIVAGRWVPVVHVGRERRQNA